MGAYTVPHIRCPSPLETQLGIYHGVGHYLLSPRVSIGLIPFGFRNGDNALTAGDDVTSDLISIKVPLVFFNSLETEIYVRIKYMVGTKGLAMYS